MHYLFCLAIYLLKNNVNSLTVQSAQPRVEEIIRNTASTIHGISKVTELKTIDLGTGGLIVNMTIEVEPEIQMKDADDIAQMLERKIKKYVIYRTRCRSYGKNEFLFKCLQQRKHN